MKKLNIKTRSAVVPMCYAYTTPEIKRHDGWTKIGYTENDVKQRIAQQTQTADVRAVLHWYEKAIYADGSGDTFSDKDFHTYLIKNDIERLDNTEWFKILPDKSHDMFFDFTKNRGILTSFGAIDYTLRAEQAKAVHDAKRYFDGKTSLDEPEFLWNAKPRFGKTLSAYDLCKQLGAQKVLILTNYPAVANSWYNDYVKFLGTESGYYFVSQVDTLKGKKYVLTREQYTKHLSDPNHKGCIEFISLQDLKGSRYFGGQYDKLQEVATIEWDLLIIDEAHYAVDTFKSNVAFDHIQRKYTLHLSGTPFKAIANMKFDEDAIFNWTYVDEQTAKRNWPKDSEEENPYAVMPQLNMYTYQMSDIVRDKLQQGADFDNDGEDEAYAFDLNEFFITNADGNFKHEESVDKFLDALVTQNRFPFSTPELRNELNHTFWLLQYVDSCKALAKKLKEHPVFKEYEIVLAAGDGRLDEEEESEKAYDKVVKAIKEHDKTITLSVRQLATGITIPEWTAVLMLGNMKTPELYMQAAFRAQNPCLFKTKSGELQRKENAYVFDFDPARTLTIFDDFANNNHSGTAGGRGDTDTRKKQIKELLNFFPVYGEDDGGEMISLDPEKVLTIPRKIHAKEVVHRGFMSNFLFQNIHNVFNAPQSLIDSLNGIEAVKQPTTVTPKTGKELNVNPETGEVEIPSETVVGLATDIFGEKIYGEQEIDTDITQVIENTVTDNKSVLDDLKQDCKENVIIPLIDKAKENYGKDVTKNVVQAIEKKVTAAADLELNKVYTDHQIEQSKLEAEKQEAVTSAVTSEDKKNVELLYASKQAELEQVFKQTVAEKQKEIIKQTCETIVVQIETNKLNKEKNKKEEEIRDHLRGFSRTVPSFLMAYGDENTTLENFDKKIPDEVFKEVTSISLEDFRFLRDGGDYKDEETGEIKHFEGHLFDSVVFNDSVKEFFNMKSKLANYFDETSKEDIFDYIPPQKTNQIFTPKKVVKEMVDYLEQENPGCFDDPDKTFIDLYMKSGLYITEIVKRLYQSKKMRKLYPDDKKRLQHIFEKQVYGLAPTEIIYKIATAYILGFDSEINIAKHNFRQYDALPAAQNGTLEKELEQQFKN